MAKVLPTRPSPDRVDPDALGRSNTNKDITVNMQAVMGAFQRSHGGLPEKVVEVVNGDLVVDQYATKVEAQGGADTDEITSITPLLITTDTGNGGAIITGNYIVLHSDKKITIKHSTAQNGVQTPSGLDVVLYKTPIVLYRNTTGWVISCLPNATDEQMQSLTTEQLAFYSANAGQVKNVENNRADLTLSNVEEVSAEFQVLLGAFTGVDPLIDYYPKTEAEKAEANGNWWRKYKSGWIEQGGIETEIPVGRLGTATLHIPFSNTNYNINLQQKDTFNSHTYKGSSLGMIANNISTTSFTFFRADNSSTTSGNFTIWEAKGF